MDPSQLATPAAQLPDSFYMILGVIIITNLGTIVTVVGAAFRVVYKFAVLETQTKALHRRLDLLEKKKYPTEEKDENES